VHRNALVPTLLTMIAGCTPLAVLDSVGPSGDGGVDATRPDAAPLPDAGSCADACGQNPPADAGSFAADDSGIDGALPPTNALGLATYDGGRVLTGVTSLVGVYWGSWSDDARSDCQNLLEPFFPWIAQTAFLRPITEYWGRTDDNAGQLPIAAPSLAFQQVHYASQPDGGIVDPDVFLESIADSTDPGAIYVIFFTSDTPLCAGLDGCSGLTPTLHVPYVRLQFDDGDGDLVSSSRAGFREVVDVITNSDGQGWSVPHGGEAYGLGGVCSRASGGGGQGNEATVRFWDSEEIGYVYATDGMPWSIPAGPRPCSPCQATRRRRRGSPSPSFRPRTT